MHLLTYLLTYLLMIYVVYTDTWGGLLVTTTVPAVDRFGWMTFGALGQNQTWLHVHTDSGVVTGVHTEMMFPSHV